VIRVEIEADPRECEPCPRHDHRVTIRIGRQTLSLCRPCATSTAITLRLAIPGKTERCASCGDRVTCCPRWSMVAGCTDVLCLRCQQRLAAMIEAVVTYPADSSIEWDATWERVEPREDRRSWSRGPQAWRRKGA